MKKIKKAQQGAVTDYTSKEKVKGDKAISKSSFKVDDRNYKIKTKAVADKDGNITTTSKTKRTLKGLLTGAPSVKKLGIDKKSTKTITPYKKGGKVKKKK